MIAGSLEIQLMANVARLQRDMDTARRIVTDTSNGISRAADIAKAALGAIGIGAGLQQVIQLSDAYTKFTAQLRLATTSQREYLAAYADVKRIATTSQADLSGTGVLYARIANGTRELGISQAQVAKVTETVNLALKVSGATTEESASAMLQLSQSFASGTLRGEEFNAVNEAAPRLMKALADGMGVPIGALKQMASDGLITSTVMADVLPQALEQLRTEAREVQTIAGAFTVLKNNLMEFTAVSAQSNGTVAVLTGGIQLLSDNLSTVLSITATLTAAKLGTWAASWVSGVYSQVAASQALIASNIARAESEVAGAAAAMATSASTAGAIAVAREEMVARLGQANATIAAARAAVAAASAAGAQSFALRTLAAATAELAVAEEIRAAAVAELALLGQQNARVNAQAAAASSAYTAALGVQTSAMGAASLAGGVLRGALAFFGGPIGLIITALGIGATAWTMWGKSSEEATNSAKGAVEASTGEIIANIEKQNEKLRERIELAKKAGQTDVAKEGGAEAERMASLLKEINALKDQGNKLSAVDQLQLVNLQGIYEGLARAFGTQKELKAALATTGAEAKALVAVRERLTGVDKQYLADLQTLQAARAAGAVGEKEYVDLTSQLAIETWKSSEAGKDAEKAAKASTSATHKEIEAYSTLISSIRSKVDENNLELAAGENATEGQKIQIKMDQELASGKMKLSAAHIAVAQSALVELGVTEQSLKLAMAQREVTKYIADSTRARDESSASLNVEYAMYGKTADARAMAMVAVEAETWKEKQLAQLRADKKPITDQVLAQLNAEEKARVLVGQATLGQGKALQYASQLAEENKRFGLEYIMDDKARAIASLKIDSETWQERIKLAGDGTEAQKILQSEYAVWYRNQAIKPELDEQKKMWESVEQTAHDTFINVFNSGKNAFDRLRDTLKNGLLDLLYQMTIKKWIFNIGATVSGGGIAGAAQAATSIGGADAVGAGASLFGSIGTAGALYNAYTSSSLGQFMSGFSGSAGAASQVLGGAPLTGAAQAGSYAAAAAPYLAAGGGGLMAYNVGQKYGGIGGAAGGFAAGAGTIAAGGALTGAAAGTGVAAGATAALAAIPVWGWAAIAALAIVGSMQSGPESSTRLMFGSNNQAGAISINERGNEGKTANYIDGSSKGAFGTFGVVSSFWMNAAQPAVQQFVKTVTDTDDALAKFMTSTEQAGVVAALTAQRSTSISGAEGSDPNGMGGLDKVFAERINTILTTVDPMLAKLVDGFKGTSQELASEAAALLDYRKNLPGVSEALFGSVVTLQDIAALRNPTEATSAAVVRITNAFTATNSVLDAFGVDATTAFGAVGLASANARQRLLEAAGGLDALVAGVQYFAQNFLSPAEQLDPVLGAVSKRMEDLGYAGVTTAEGYTKVVKDLVESSRLGTVEGDKLFVELLKLGPSFKTLADAAKTAHDKLVANVDTAFSALERSVNAEKKAKQEAHDAVMAGYEKSITTSQDAIAKLTSLSKSLQSTLDSMDMPGQEAASRAAAQAQIATALAIARAGGPLPGSDDIQKSLSTVAQDSSDLFASYQDYQRDFAMTRNDISDLAKLTGTSLTTEEKHLAELERMRDYEQYAYDRQISALDNLLSQAQAEIDAIKGVDNSVKSLSDAILGVNDASKAAGGAGAVGTVNPADAVADMMKDVQRSNDAFGGNAYYFISGVNDYAAKKEATDKLASIIGGSGDDAWAWTGHTEAYWQEAQRQFDAGMHPTTESIKGFANGGSHAGGWRIVGESGPELEATGPSRIMSNSDLMSSLRGGDNAELLDATLAVRDELVALRKANSAENVAIVKHAMTTAEVLDGAVNGGVPILMETA